MSLKGANVFLIRLWSLALSLVVAIPAPVINYRRIAAQDLRYSVLLHMRGTQKDRNGKIRRVSAGCSGTYVAPRLILTAAHCFTGYDADKMWARGPDDILGYQVKVYKLDSGLDLALVSTVYPHAYAKLGASPHVGDEVLNIGSPLDFEFIASQGIVSALHFDTNEFRGTYTVSTAMVDHGSSGGGMFDKKGRLIGVNTLSVGMFGWGGLTMAVDDVTIRGFLLGIHS